MLKGAFSVIRNNFHVFFSITNCSTRSTVVDNICESGLLVHCFLQHRFWWNLKSVCKFGERGYSLFAGNLCWSVEFINKNGPIERKERTLTEGREQISVFSFCAPKTSTVHKRDVSKFIFLLMQCFCVLALPNVGSDWTRSSVEMLLRYVI